MTTLRSGRAHAAAFLLAFAFSAAAAADDLTWKEANRRSAEAITQGDFKAGAELARQAFDLYGKQSKSYAATSHAQLLLNAVDARRRAANRKQALDELNRGANAIATRGGPNDPVLLSLWQEAIRISRSDYDRKAVDRYYEKSVAQAERMWGKDDPRAIRIHTQWAHELRGSKDATWVREKLGAARERAARDGKDPVLLYEIDLLTAQFEAERQRWGAALGLYRPLLPRLEVSGEPAARKMLPVAYAQVEHVLEQTGDAEGLADVRGRLKSVFAGHSEKPEAFIRVAPDYPASIGTKPGSVKLLVTIAPDGQVQDASVITSDPPGVYDQAAVEAILQWRFRPRLVDGKPVEQKAFQTFSFEKK